MHNIHLVEKSGIYEPVAGSKDEWLSGTWYLGAKTAESLIGGCLFLHRYQKFPCYMGGKVISCERVGKSRYTIRFRLDPSVTSTTTFRCKKNWARWRLLEPVSA